nr:hypothetical protein TgIb.0460c [Toxoplasma gondii RH]
MAAWKKKREQSCNSTAILCLLVFYWSNEATSVLQGIRSLLFLGACLPGNAGPLKFHDNRKYELKDVRWRYNGRLTFFLL